MMMMMIYLSEEEKKVEPILQSESGALFTLDTKFFSFISDCTKWTGWGKNRAQGVNIPLS